MIATLMEGLDGPNSDFFVATVAMAFRQIPSDIPELQAYRELPADVNSAEGKRELTHRLRLFAEYLVAQEVEKDYANGDSRP